MATQEPVVEKKDNYFSLQLKEGSKVEVLIDGVKAIALIVPYESFLNCYLKRDALPITYKI